MVASLSSGFLEIYTRNKNSSLFASRWYFFLELGSFCGPDPRFQVFVAILSFHRFHPIPQGKRAKFLKDMTIPYALSALSGVGFGRLHV